MRDKRLLFSLLAMMLAAAATGALAEEAGSQTTVAQEAAVTEEPDEAVAPAYQLVWTGPRSLDSLIDERRDALRERREARSDAMRLAYGIVNPYFDWERQAWREQSDRMRDLYRSHRDAMKYHHDLFRGAFMPWAKAQSDWAEARRYAFAMESLDRQELLEELRFAYEPIAW